MSKCINVGEDVLIENTIKNIVRYDDFSISILLIILI